MEDFERKLDRLRNENEVEDQELSLEQKRTIRRQLRHQEGKDWKRAIGAAVGSLGKVRVDGDALQDLYGMDHTGAGMRNLSRPGRR